MTRIVCDKCGKEDDTHHVQTNDHSEGELMHSADLCRDCRRVFRHLIHDFVKSVIARN